MGLRERRVRGGGRGIDVYGRSEGWAERGRGFEDRFLVECGLDKAKRYEGKGTCREGWGLCTK